MSKLLTLFRPDGNSNTDAIRQSTTLTMAYLLEQNRKFELFMREKVERLEQLVSSQQQTRANFDEAYDNDFLETEIGDGDPDDSRDERGFSSRRPVTSLVEDELLTASPAPVGLPEPPATLEDTSTAPIAEANEADLGIFGMPADRVTSPSAGGQNPDNLPSWEFFLAENSNNGHQGAAGADCDEDEPVPGERTPALIELKGESNLKMVAEGPVHSPLMGDAEIAAPYDPDIVDDMSSATECGIIEVETPKTITEDELQGEVAKTEAKAPIEDVAMSLLPAHRNGQAQGSIPYAADEDETSQPAGETGDQKNLTSTGPEARNVPVVMRTLGTSRPVGFRLQPLEEDEAEEIEALIPAWLKEKLL